MEVNDVFEDFLCNTIDSFNRALRLQD